MFGVLVTVDDSAVVVNDSAQTRRSIRRMEGL